MLSERLVDLRDDAEPLCGLSPGRYCFNVFPNGIAIEPACIDVTPETERVVIRWR